MTTPIGITLSLDGVQKFEADGRRAAGTVDSIGVSAKQTAAALRGVPAQFTDIITSLQGGQAPLTVLLQQGGQLKDMFGGVGAAAKGLGGYVAGLVNPFSMAAAAAIGVAVAYKQGSAEADSYRAALITTGNAAGATAAQMQQMAGRIGAIVGTQGAAADALAQMAGSGRVAAQNFEYFGEVALKTEKSIGTAVSETVKQFAELGKSPVEASRKLNEETNYLTAAIYEQIKALKDQGRDADAAALAQKTYADALNGRSAQMTQNLGVIEKAWQGITGAAKGAWDAMLNVGRQDTLATKMDDVRAKIAQAQGQDKNRRFSLPWDTPLAELQQQLSYLSEEERMLRRGAEAQAARTQAEKAAIDAADALRKTQEKGLTKQQQMNKALEEYRKQQDELRATKPTSALLSPGAIAVGEKVIRDQFKETGSRSGAQANAYAAEQEAAKVWAITLKDVEKGIADVEEKTLGLNKAQAALLEYISSPAYATNSEEMRQAALARLYAWDAAIKNADGIKAEKAAMEQASKAMATWFDARSKDASALTSQVQARREEVAAMGLSADAVARLSAAKYEQAAAEQEAYAAALKSAKLYAGEYAQAYDAAAQDALDQAKRLRELGSLDLAKGQKQAALDAEAEWKRTSYSINQSLTDALLRGFESGKDFAKNLRDTVVNMFKTMVLRPVISAIVNPVAGAITGAMGLSGAAQAGQGISALGAAGNVASLAGGIGSFTTAGMLPGAMATALTGSTSSLAMGLSGAWGAGGGMLSTLNAGASMLGSGSIMSGLGTLAGALGPIAIGIAALAAIFGKKATPHAGAASTYSEAGGLVSSADIYQAVGFRDTRTYNAGVEQVTGNVAKAIGDTLNSTAKAFGKTAGYEITTAFADDTSKDGAWGSLIIKQDGKSVLDWRDTQTSKWAPKEFADGEAGSKEYMAAIAVSARDALVQAIGGVDWATDMLKALGDSPTLESLAGTVDQINAAKVAFVQFGKLMPEFADLSQDAVSKMAEAVGGAGALVRSMDVFTREYFTDAERQAVLRADLTAEFGKLGFSLPRTREELKALVQSQWALGAAGAETAGRLVQLSETFATLTQSADDARNAAFNSLQRSVDAQKRMLDSQRQAAESVVSDLSGIFDLLHDSVRSLYGEVDSTRGMLAQQGGDFIAQALATARATGYLPDADKLAEAISDVRAGLDASNFSSAEERDYAALVLAGQLSGLEDLAGQQLTDAKRTVYELEKHSKQLDQTLDYWQQQIDLASGTYEAIVDMTAAIDGMSQQLFTTTGTTKPLTAGGSGSGGGGSGFVAGAGYAQRVGYGAEEALGSFDKFKAWYDGLRHTADPKTFMNSGYEVPDWLRMTRTAADGTDKELFAQYLFFKNNPQYAQDYEQIMTAGRSSFATDGSTLVRSDLSKMPTEAADFFRGDTASLLSYEGLGLDPVLGYQLYKYGPERFGLNQRTTSFTQWLRTHKWTENGIIENDNAASLNAAGFSNYRMARWDTTTGNLVNVDGQIYTPDGRPLGTASRAQMEALYGSAFVGTSGGSYGEQQRSSLYNQHIANGATEADYYAAIKTNLDREIANGITAQGVVDAMYETGASMHDVAAAYGITVAQLEENLRNGGATGIPAFAVGTNYVPRDMLAQIHEGEAIVPKAYNPAANPGWGARDTGRLEALVEQLIAKVAALETSAASTAASTGRSADVLASVKNGNAIVTTAVPTF